MKFILADWPQHICWVAATESLYTYFLSYLKSL
uniref:Uncharacterized protein n=1 Tax=Arundo donax TaxID=35708 RepID=A0A0A9B6N8_ARUDO